MRLAKHTPLGKNLVAVSGRKEWPYPLSLDLALDPATVRLFIDKAKAVSADLDMEKSR